MQTYRETVAMSGPRAGTENYREDPPSPDMVEATDVFTGDFLTLFHRPDTKPSTTEGDFGIILHLFLLARPNTALETPDREKLRRNGEEEGEGGREGGGSEPAKNPEATCCCLGAANRSKYPCQVAVNQPVEESHNRPAPLMRHLSQITALMQHWRPCPP